MSNDVNELTDDNIDEVHSKDACVSSTTQGVGISMNIKNDGISAARLYMVGKNQGKAAVIRSPTPRLINTGDEQEYAHTARKVELDCDSIVEAIFYMKDPLNETQPLYWGGYYTIFKAIDSGEYFLLEMPKVHNQNMELGFEFIYDKKLMKQLAVGAFFPGGTVFGQSARITDQGEWCPGREVKIAPMSDTMCEEDSVKISQSLARDMGITFNRKLGWQWNESEWVLLNLYGTIDNPQPFPLSGEEIRSDRIVIGWRRKDHPHALAALTKKALMNPDATYDRLLFGAPGSVVADILVETDRYKNQSNNKKAYKRTQPSTRHLEMYESAGNRFYNDVVRWYENKLTEYGHKHRPPIEDGLWNFILYAYGQRSVDFVNSSGQYVRVKRKFRNILLKDWRIVISLKQEVDAKVRFKVTGMHGNKATIGEILPDEHMPIDDYGIRADMVGANFPDFRRQIISSLTELDTNFINIRIYAEIRDLVLEGKYKDAWDKVMYFYNTVAPYFADMCEEMNEEERIGFLKHISKSEYEFSVCFLNDQGISSFDIAENIDKRYPNLKPTPVTYVDRFGETVRTKNPIGISSVYYLMLDKVGDDISSQSTSKLNIFGLPTSLSKEERNRNFFRAHVNRNMGATEGRLSINQNGGAMTTKALVLGNSPEMINTAVRRIIEADNPFRIPELVYNGEEKKNYSLMLIKSILGDFGLRLAKAECN